MKRIQNSIMKTVLLLGVTLMVALPASAQVRIDPNADLTMRGNTEYNNSDPFGLFVKTANTDVSYIEFTLGSVAASQANLVLWQGDPGPSALWNVKVRGAEYSFTEGAGDFGSGNYVIGTEGTGNGNWPDVGTINGVQAVGFYNLDLTSWYNANLNKTMTLCLYVPAVPNTGSGPIFEDREGTKTGDAVTYGDRLEVTVVPEPGTLSLLMLSAGIGMMILRRRKV